MSISNAINFLAKVQVETDFRKECYKCKNREELHTFLENEGFKFTELEFENGINHLLLRCEDESQAYMVEHLKSWYTLFI